MTQAVLPEGFVPDQNATLPPGFVLDDNNFADEAKRRRGVIKNFGEQFLSSVVDMAAGLGNLADRSVTNLTPLSLINRATGSDVTVGKLVSGFTGVPTPDQVAASVDPGDPVSIAGHAGRLGGLTAGLAISGGPVAGLVKKAPQGAGKIRSFSQNLVANLGERFKSAPVTTTLAETGLGTAAGAGGEISVRISPDSDWARLRGEIIGGVLPALTPIGLVLRTGATMKEKVTSGGSVARRASERLDRAIGDAREQALRELDAPTTIDPATGRPVLSVYDRTGDPGMLSLQRDILESSDLARRGGDQQLARANEVLQENLFDIGKATTAETRELMNSLMETRLRVAVLNAEQRIASVGPKITEEQANRIASEEVQKALDAAVDQRLQLFRLIDKNARVPTSTAEEAMKILASRRNVKSARVDPKEIAGNLIEPVPLAQLDDIPQDAIDAMTPKGKKYYGKETSVDELIGLQNKLHEVARNARKNGEFNKARIADMINDAITVDIGNAKGGPSVKEAVDKAMGFSADMRTRFKQGTIGTLLAKGKEGGEVVDPSLWLERAIGSGKTKGRQALDDLLSAFDSQEAPPSTEFIAATEEFLKNKFTNKAFPRGDFNKNAAQKFLQDNDELLNRLPILKAQLQETVKAGRALDVLDSVSDPRISKTALFIKKSPDKAFSEISQLSVERQGTEIQKLINLAAKDKTGQASSGLKKSYLEYITRDVSGQRDVTGKTFLSGFKLADELERTKTIAGKLFNKDELNRIEIIKNDLIKLEKSRTARASEEGILGDVVGKNLEMIFRGVGAASGRKVADVTGSGASIQLANFGANRFRELGIAGIQDPGRKLIIDTIEDENLFRTLLQGNVDDPLEAAQMRRALNVWFVAVLAEHGKDVEIAPQF